MRLLGYRLAAVMTIIAGVVAFFAFPVERVTPCTLRMIYEMRTACFGNPHLAVRLGILGASLALGLMLSVAGRRGRFAGLPPRPRLS